MHSSQRGGDFSRSFRDIVMTTTKVMAIKIHLRGESEAHPAGRKLSLGLWEHVDNDDDKNNGTLSQQQQQQ